MKTTEKVNQLIHRIEKTKDGKDYIIKIKLADECHNGHNDFSITGEIYPKGLRGDRNSLGMGAIGDTIAKVFPELAIFNDLHLCDVNGAPMYAIENGFYFIQSEPQHIKSHFRVNDKEAEILKTAEDRTQLIYMIEQMGLIKRWKDEANKAIAMLEEMTGQKFEDNSQKIQRITLKAKDKALIDSRIKAGYYTPEKQQERKGEEKKSVLALELEEIEKELKADIKTHTDEYNVKKAILLAGLSIKNFIYYNHTNEGVFNWLDYEKQVSKAEFEGLMDWIKLESPELPIGIIFKLGK